MKVSITARKFKARETLKDFITAEVVSLEKYNDDLLDVEVILSFQNNKDSLKIAELVVKVPGLTLTSSDQSEEFEPAVRSAIDKMGRQLQKLKTKRSAHTAFPEVPEDPDTTEDND
jgi:putative sigma-54 modulation protein